MAYRICITCIHGHEFSYFIKTIRHMNLTTYIPKGRATSRRKRAFHYREQ